ncbi:hypothetical protein [Desulfofustis phage LS06-2018-MD01]|nr:hypothetical protein [Desulfofustis phage LS06-2018-MD01]
MEHTKLSHSLIQILFLGLSKEDSRITKQKKSRQVNLITCRVVVQSGEIGAVLLHDFTYLLPSLQFVPATLRDCSALFEAMRMPFPMEFPFASPDFRR